MKKTIVFAIVIVSLFAVGTAFAGDRGTIYNGITYFDNRPASTGGEQELAGNNESTMKMFNGITAFDLAQSGTSAKRSPVGQLAEETTSKSDNGITLF